MSAIVPSWCSPVLEGCTRHALQVPVAVERDTALHPGGHKPRGSMGPAMCWIGAMDKDTELHSGVLLTVRGSPQLRATRPSYGEAQGCLEEAITVGVSSPNSEGIFFLFSRAFACERQRRENVQVPKELHHH